MFWVGPRFILSKLVRFAIFFTHITMVFTMYRIYNRQRKQEKTERVLPLSHKHFIPLYTHMYTEKTRYPQYLVFCCLSSFIICNPPDGPPGSYPPDLNNDPVLLPAAVPPQVRSGAPESRFDCIFLQFRPIFYIPEPDKGL